MNGSNGGPLVTNGTLDQRCLSGGVWGDWQSYAAVVPGEPLETWAGASTPGFKSLVAQGKLIPHQPYLWTYEYVDTCETSWSFRSSDGLYGCETRGRAWYNFGQPTDFPVLPEPDVNISSLAHEAAAKAMESSVFDAGTFIGEAMEIRRLWTTATQSLARLMQSGIKSSQGVADLLDVWLSLRYGLRPLIGDLERLEKALTAMEHKEWIFSKGKSTVRLPIDNVSNWISVGNYAFDIRCRWVHRGYLSAAFHVVAQSNPVKCSIDPAVTAWELVPYSFVIDWLWNVGSWISAVRLNESGLNTASSLNLLYEYQTYLETDASPNSSYTGGLYVALSKTTVQKKRVPMSVNTDQPAFNAQPMSVYKMLDAFALIMGPVLKAAFKRWSYIPFYSPYFGFQPYH